ncbi:uncharacterized protein LOC131881216 isoform X1 [Tigriopus californicus]|uniref:uncharacterized protein LOC131881216 isoform X1 n=2 Tax=Tigriopus californicus TaxID=6832 RepID=UPI0027D9DB15|nr:uncharacterized protein LOC131881216 isoform X1 [Tigriopus californicus]
MASNFSGKSVKEVLDTGTVANLSVIMDQESNQMEQQSVQCRNGCGFYGNAGSEGYCSVCYKEVIKKKQQPPTNMPSSLAPTHGTMASLSIDEACSISPTASSPLKSTSLNTASPTVLIPPSQMEKIKIHLFNNDQSFLQRESETDMSGSSALLGGSPLPSDINAVAASPSSSSPSEDADSGAKDGKKKKNRCGCCKKKVGLTGFTCRCGGLFCSIHRYSDKHDCPFDYKELGAEEIRKSNPMVVAKKIQKI